MKYLKRNFLWIIYAIFIVLVFINRGDEHPFISHGPYPLGKYLIWFGYLAFLSYSIYCSFVENFFGSLKKIYPLRWGRQIGLDLYIGLILSLGIIYLNEGSLLVMLFWLIPVLIYANLAILLYAALNYDGIISQFL